MDDPTRRCENDTGKLETRHSGPCSQARAHFFAYRRLKQPAQPFYGCLP